MERLSGVPAPRVSLPPVVERASAWLLYQAKGRLLGNWDKSLDPVYVEMGQAFWYTGEAVMACEAGGPCLPGLAWLDSVVASLHVLGPFVSWRTGATCSFGDNM